MRGAEQGEGGIERDEGRAGGVGAVLHGGQAAGGVGAGMHVDAGAEWAGWSQAIHLQVGPVCGDGATMVIGRGGLDDNFQNGKQLSYSMAYPW